MPNRQGVSPFAMLIGSGDMSKKSPQEIAAVWVEYKKTGNEDLRNELMEHYLALVKYNAERIYSRLPEGIDIDDLMSAGIFGLMDAVDAFDLERGIKFETYCAPRIRGAILDELREMDWAPRLVRSRTSQIDKARFSLQMKLGRNPSDDELREELDVDEEAFAKIRKDGNAAGLVSLSRKWFETDSNKDVREIDVLKDPKQSSPLNDAQRQCLKELITKGLNRAERLIIILYYYEEMTMKEIGAAMDLSGSRISQMHSSIIQRLKAQLPRDLFGGC